MAAHKTTGYGTPSTYTAAKKPPSAPAASTWTPQNLQGLANAYSALNPTWTPPAAQNAALPQPIQPVKFDPYADPGYAGVASAVQGANEHAQNEYNYQTHRGAQEYGYDQAGNQVTTGPDLNPYAEAALLKRSYDQTTRGTRNSYASQGQLYAGSLKNAQATNDFNYGQSSDRLQRTASDFYHNQGNALASVQGAGQLQLAQLLGPTFAAWLASQKG